MSRPSKRSSLAILTRVRLLEIAKLFELEAASGAKRAELVDIVASSKRASFERILEVLKRDELKEICRAHGLDDGGRAKQDLVDRILGRDAAPSLPGVLGTLPEADDEPRERSPEPSTPVAAEPLSRADAARQPEPATFPVLRSIPAEDPSALPLPGELVRVRHRQYLVESVHPPREPKQMTRIALVCLDDDDQGKPLEVLWELELGARRLDPARQGLGEVRGLDPPRVFAAYLHAIKWSCVTATNARLFQAPFRAGIQIFQHQLAPLRKALELPRANLFIADDVGLGKTVEAGLVMQELLLRQRLDFVLVVVPATITLQWRHEMERRFGLRFEIFDRDFVARRRRERGFGVNPWSTHNRFIVSYQTLRRPEHRDPLLQVLGTRRRKSMLVLDEAHTVAPASATKYAVDSTLTRVARDIAPRFENRLFLSATPHNGHSNSFSALLEILDPQRFTRGVRVSGPAALEPVMVRRLKKDLRALGTGQFPHRRLVELSLEHRDGQWWQSRTDGATGEPARAIGAGSGAELRMAELLAEYAAHARPTTGRGRLVFINLQKRLLSSVEAFFRTLHVHARTVGRALGEAALGGLGEPVERLETRPEAAGADDEEIYGRDDDDDVEQEVRAGSRALAEGDARTAALLQALLDLAGRHRAEPDAKALALLAWIREHQCPAVAAGGAMPGASGVWSDTRLIVFTEYTDTKRYLQQLLAIATAGTDRAAERVVTLHGGMSDEAREEVQTAWNGDPRTYPARILIATDAAREGVNLQARCADLLHYDVPWNPARLEQRNGRIDRTLQPAAEVRCMYVVQPQRVEDRVLATLVRKVERIAEELGSLSQVVMDRIERALADGIDERTEARLERAELARELERTVAEELLDEGADAQAMQRLRDEIDACGQLEEESRRQLEFDPRLLKDALDVSCELLGVGPLRPVEGKAADGPALWRLPELPPSWERTLDSLRPPRGRDEEVYEWRRRPLLPVSFEPGRHLSVDRVHLHLQHPFVQRALARFLAQGTSMHDLSRATVMRTRYTSAARVVAFGRLSLFGRGATRLHDRVVPVVAPWLEGKGKTHLQPFVSDADREALLRFEDALREAPTEDDVPEVVRQRLAASAAEDFATLWPHVEAAAAAEEDRARTMLVRRGAQEAEALRGILDRQRAAIEQALAEGQQGLLRLEEADDAQQRQFRADQRHMQQRLERLEREREEEPAEIVAGYEVLARRLEPLGLVYLWPQNR